METIFRQAFIDATIDVVKTMAMIEPVPLEGFLKTPEKPFGDVSGVIGLVSANLRGGMAAVFPKACILKITSNMLYEEFNEVCDDVNDCVGELTNMICGGVKRRLEEKKYIFHLTLPSIVAGEDHVVYHMTAGPVEALPFRMEEGTFHIEAFLQPVGESILKARKKTE